MGLAADGGRLPKAMAQNADPGRAVNCHVRPEASPAWREALTFRDRLRADDALAVRVRRAQAAAGRGAARLDRRVRGG